jgi:predicted Fe-Mo cluster-binding NifX family protein
MLILIGSDGNDLNSSISKRFGHADYFIVFDTIKESFKSYENIDEGHNHKNLQDFLDEGVEAFVVGNIGPHAFDLINKLKSKVYLARKMSVKAAIEKFNNNELTLLTEPTAKQSIGHSHHDEHHEGHHHDGQHRGRGHHRHN